VAVRAPTLKAARAKKWDQPRGENDETTNRCDEGGIQRDRRSLQPRVG
jgi:hypothetical protein